MSPKYFQKYTLETQHSQDLGDERNQKKPLSLIIRVSVVEIPCVFLFVCFNSCQHEIISSGSSFFLPFFGECLNG